MVRLHSVTQQLELVTRHNESLKGAQVHVHSPLTGHRLWKLHHLNTLPPWRQGYDLGQSGDRAHMGYGLWPASSQPITARGARSARHPSMTIYENNQASRILHNPLFFTSKTCHEPSSWLYVTSLNSNRSFKMSSHMRLAWQNLWRNNQIANVCFLVLTHSLTVIWCELLFLFTHQLFLPNPSSQPSPDFLSSPISSISKLRKSIQNLTSHNIESSKKARVHS